MIKENKIVFKGGEGEFTEKKSRFIATICPVNSEEDAINFIDVMKKKYWNATHNCSAFVIGDNSNIQKFSDDGEPSGTAGRPMLDVIIGNNIINAAVVVTRYFGGTLLGTGGLVRAYQKSVNAGLENCELLIKKQGYLLTIKTDYHGLGKIQYIIDKMNVNLMGIDYSELVLFNVVINNEYKDIFISKVNEATNAKASVTVEKEVGFVNKNNKCIII